MVTACTPLLILVVCPPVADEAKIRWLLSGHEGIGLQRVEFARAGGYSPAAFPLYARMIDDPKIDPVLAAAAMQLVGMIRADRSQFLERALSRLTDQHPSARCCAVELLAHIGGEREIPLAVALLADETWEVPFAAANTLVKIGNRRAVVAMDVWLKYGQRRENPNSDEAVRKHVAKCRDELKARLDRADATRK